MVKIPAKTIGKVLLTTGKFASKYVTKETVNSSLTNYLENRKDLIQIPNLEETSIDDAVRILKDEYNLVPIPVILKPSVEYINGNGNEVIYSIPRFGKKVKPRTAVKVYYLTPEVIEKSIELSKSGVKEFKLPSLIGLDIYEAKEDLELLGLRVSEKLEKPDLKFIDKEDNQIIRVTNSNGKKMSAKVKTGDRIWLYYVNEQVIEESKTLKDKKENDNKGKIDRIRTSTKDVSNDIITGVKEVPQNISRRIKKPFINKNDKNTE